MISAVYLAMSNPVLNLFCSDILATKSGFIDCQLEFLKPRSKSEVGLILFKRGKAQSSSSMHTPSKAPIAGSISIKFKLTGWSGPNIAPEAILKSNE